MTMLQLAISCLARAIRNPPGAKKAMFKHSNGNTNSSLTHRMEVEPAFNVEGAFGQAAVPFGQGSANINVVGNHFKTSGSFGLPSISSMLGFSKEGSLTPPDVAEISLQKLRSADRQAVKATFDSLKNHGFAWLDFGGDKLGTDSITALAEMGDFLAKHEHQGSPHAMEGHFSAAHKDGLRLVTGTWMQSQSSASSANLPEDLRQKVFQVAMLLDAAQEDVVKALAPAIGLPSSQAVGESFDIPLLCAEKSGALKYGLLDVVRYRMGTDSPDEVVAPHADPGLFILSLPCATPGLQLKDATGSWRPPPSGFGVLWAGEAGIEAGFKSGIHRVVASPDRAPRLSAWHELCTRSQLCPPMLQFLQENHLQLKLGKITGTAEVLSSLQQSEDHHNVQLVERRGVPVGKSGAIIREQFVPWTANGKALYGLFSAPRNENLQLASGQVEIVPLDVPMH